MTGRSVEQLEQRVAELEAEVSSLQAALAGWPGMMAEALRAVRALTVQGIADQLRAYGDAEVARTQRGRDEPRERAQVVDGALRTIADRLTAGKMADGRTWDVDRVLVDAELTGRLRAARDLLLGAVEPYRSKASAILTYAQRVHAAHRVLAGAPLSEVADVDER